MEESFSRVAWIRTAWAHLAIVLLGGAIFFLQGPQLIFHPGERLADNGDSVLNAWILAWNAHALFDSRLSVWDAPIFYPAKNTFAFSEVMFGNLWLTLPVQYLSDNPILASNALVFVSFVAGMYCTFLLVRRLTGSYFAAIVAGALFSFNPLRWAEISHVQLLPFFWAPLAFLWCHQFLESRKTRYFWGMLLALVTQYYASIYLGTILFTSLFLFGSFHLILECRGRDRFFLLTDRRLLLTIVAGGMVGLLILLPLGWPYLQSTRAWNFVRSESDNVNFSCEPLSFLAPNGSFRTYRKWSSLFEKHIHGSFGLGLTPWLLAATGLLLALRSKDSDPASAPLAKRFAWTALAVAVLMLGPYLIFFNHKYDVPLPYLLIYHLLPGAKAMRVPARYVFPLLLCLSVLGGFAVRHGMVLLKKRRLSFQLLTGLLLIGAISIDYSLTDNPGVPYEAKKDFPPVYRYLATSSSSAPVLELPANWMGQFRYLHYQTSHWRPLVGGESGSFTPAVIELSKRTSGRPTEGTLRFLQLAPAQTVVIHLDLYEGDAKEAWRSADLTPHGFYFLCQKGDALVWERSGSLLRLSEKLSVSKPRFEITSRFLRSQAEIHFDLSCAEKSVPWRFIHRGVSAFEITLVDADGHEQTLVKQLEVPPYLLPGETAPVRTGRFSCKLQNIERIKIRSAVVEDFEAKLVAKQP